MKLCISLLSFLLSTVSVSSTISGDFVDTAICGEFLIEADCAFEADPDRRRRNRNRRNLNRKLNGGKGTKEDGFINSCTVMIDGVKVETTIKEITYTEVTFDETVKGDDVVLELFASLIKVSEPAITGLAKLETFAYDVADVLSKDDSTTTLKTFSIAWSGC